MLAQSQIKKIWKIKLKAFRHVNTFYDSIMSVYIDICLGVARSHLSRASATLASLAMKVEFSYTIIVRIVTILTS